jgi:cysteine synthase
MSTAINMAKNEPDKYHFTDQYFNKKNYEAHEASGQEILKEL